MALYDITAYKKALKDLTDSVVELFKSPVPEADRADSVNQFNGRTAEQYISDANLKTVSHANDFNNPHKNTPETLGAYDNETIKERLTHAVPEGRIPISSYGFFGYDKLPVTISSDGLTVTLPSYGCIIAGYSFTLPPLNVSFIKDVYMTWDIYVQYRRGKATYLMRDASRPKLPDTYVTMYLGIVRYQQYGGAGAIIPSPVRLDVYRPNSFGYKAMAIPASNNGSDTSGHLPKPYMEDDTATLD